MSVTMTHYWPLLILLALPLVWWVRRHTAVGLARRHLLFSTVVRTVVIVALALALMQPVWNRAGRWISVVYALDISSSIDPAFIDTAIGWISSTATRGNPAHSGFVAFAGSARSVAGPDDIRGVEVSAGGADRSIDQSATNLEAAVAQALRRFDPRYLKRLVLITDGNENAGDMMKAEFRTMAECLSAIKSNSGQNLEVITDKPQEVSGFLSNGKGFGCSRKESGTKGVYFEGWFMVD